MPPDAMITLIHASLPLPFRDAAASVSDAYAAATALKRRYYYCHADVLFRASAMPYALP